MKKVLFVLLAICLFNFSYSQQMVDTVTYRWDGKIVSKKKYDILLHRFTINFCKNYRRK